MYTRRDVCKLTGIEEGRFKTLMRREQLPTLPASPTLNSDDYRDETAVRGWNRFTAFEVVSIAVSERFMCQIGYADGLRPETAAEIAGNAGAGIAEMLEKRRGQDVWVGYVGQPVERGGTDGGRNIHGTIFQIAKRVAELMEPGTSDPAAERLFLVNASEVLRTIEMRAKENEILFPNDETIEQG